MAIKKARPKSTVKKKATSIRKVKKKATPIKKVKKKATPIKRATKIATPIKKVATKTVTAKKRLPKKSPAKTVRKKDSVSPGFTELIGHALTDKEFRQTLFTNRAQAIKKYRLTPSDVDALGRITRKQLELQAGKLGGRTAITIKVVISKSF